MMFDSNEFKTLLVHCRQEIEDANKPLNENEKAFVHAIRVSVGEVVADATGAKAEYNGKLYRLVS